MQSPGTWWETYPSPSATCLTVSFCFACWHTLHKQISAYTKADKDPRTDTLMTPFCAHITYKTCIFSQWQMCTLYSLTLSFLQSKLQTVRDSMRNGEKEREGGGKDVLYDPSPNERSLRGLSLCPTWVIYPYIRQQTGGWRTEGQCKQRKTLERGL